MLTVSSNHKDMAGLDHLGVCFASWYVARAKTERESPIAAAADRLF